jgi:hypothetical protein
MARRTKANTESLSLDALGLDAAETATYLCVLDHPRSTAAEIADAMEVPARLDRVEQSLRAGSSRIRPSVRDAICCRRRTSRSKA